jgi:pyruvate dehydrogenase E2 component (dihydrolipoamide acetyltransferase)
MGEFRMPSLGADMDAGTITEWLVHPGDAVHRGDIVAVVDTDKADVEVEIFEDGVVEELLVAEGSEVAVGTPLARIGAAGAEPSVAPPAAGRPEPPPEPSSEPAPTRWRAPRPAAHVSPVVRRLAAELGVDLANLSGTGKGGGITRADVERAAGAPAARPVAAAPPEPPPAPPSARSTRRASPRARRLASERGIDLEATTPTGPSGAVVGADVERAEPPARRPTVARAGRATDKAAGMRAAIARAMARSKREIPHYYLATQIDFSRARAHLLERNEPRPVTERVLPAALLLKATAIGVRSTPELNGFWVDDEYQPSDAVHLGVAISLRGGGLVAPAIHDADDRTLDDLMAALRDLVTRARAGSLRASEMSDPTMTVTNLGEQGVETVYGVIYPPQVALVGFGSIVERPWAADGMVGAHPTVTATLAGDHRASDGASGARLLNVIDRLLQEPEGL